MIRRRAGKFNNRRTVVDGIAFASQREARCYQDLKLREKAGEIADLKLQVPYDLTVNGTKVCRYVADFTFTERTKYDERFVVADPKGFKTPVYRLKAKLMRAVHQIEIKEL